MSSSTPSLDGYKPSVPLAAVGAILFSLAAGCHVYLYFRLKAWFFYMMLIGVLAEAAGYCARAYWASNLTNPLAFLINYCTLILAPSFLAAACYMTFGRIVWLVTPPERRSFSSLWVPPRWITPIFVLFDIGSFFIQLLGVAAVGSAFSSTTVDQTNLQSGIHTLKFGLVLQLLCFGIFAVIGSRFMLVSRGWSSKTVETRLPWRALAWAVNVSASIITARGVYRVFEFSTSTSKSQNYLTTHEWTFWACDAIPILVVLVIFIVVHPAHCLPPHFTRPRLNKRALMTSNDVPGGFGAAELNVLSYYPTSAQYYATAK